MKVILEVHVNRTAGPPAGSLAIGAELAKRFAMRELFEIERPDGRIAEYQIEGISYEGD